MAVLKHGLKGEVCSLFFGDTAAVNPKLENFLGVTVNNFTPYRRRYALAGGWGSSITISAASCAYPFGPRPRPF